MYCAKCEDYLEIMIDVQISGVSNWVDCGTSSRKLKNRRIKIKDLKGISFGSIEFVTPMGHLN